MKIVISILLIPLEILAFLTFAMWGFYFLCADMELASSSTPQAHVFKALLYMAIGLGLPGAVLCTLAGTALGIASFIFKSWTRAVLSLAVAAGGVYVWYYFLNVSYPG